MKSMTSDIRFNCEQKLDENVFKFTKNFRIFDLICFKIYRYIFHGL